MHHTIEEAKADFRESVEDCRDLALADGECIPETFLERGSRDGCSSFFLHATSRLRSSSAESNHRKLMSAGMCKVKNGSCP